MNDAIGCRGDTEKPDGDYGCSRVGLEDRNGENPNGRPEEIEGHKEGYGPWGQAQELREANVELGQELLSEVARL